MSGDFETHPVGTAQRIKTLEAENTRLREALQEVVDNCGQCGGNGSYVDVESVTGKSLWWNCSDSPCKIARAALKGDE